MTHVTMIADKDGVFEVTCDGHATGSDAMCTAISTLTQTLYGWVRNKEDVKISQQAIVPGHFHLRFHGGNAGEVFFYVLVGMLQLQETDSEHISVEFYEK